MYRANIRPLTENKGQCSIQDSDEQSLKTLVIFTSHIPLHIVCGYNSTHGLPI